MGANLALNQAGKNRDSDKYDFAYLHYGDRKFRTGLVTEGMALHLVEPILEAGKSALEGGDARRVAQAAGQGVLRGGGGLAGNLRPEIRRGGRVTLEPSVHGRRKRNLETRGPQHPRQSITHAHARQNAGLRRGEIPPAVNRFLDSSYANVDWGPGWQHSSA